MWKAYKNPTDDKLYDIYDIVDDSKLESGYTAWSSPPIGRSAVASGLSILTATNICNEHNKHGASEAARWKICDSDNDLAHVLKQDSGTLLFAFMSRDKANQIVNAHNASLDLEEKSDEVRCVLYRYELAIKAGNDRLIQFNRIERLPAQAVLDLIKMGYVVYQQRELSPYNHGVFRYTLVVRKAKPKAESHTKDADRYILQQNPSMSYDSLSVGRQYSADQYQSQYVGYVSEHLKPGELEKILTQVPRVLERFIRQWPIQGGVTTLGIPSDEIHFYNKNTVKLLFKLNKNLAPNR